jgi:hypothetical protein
MYLIGINMKPHEKFIIKAFSFFIYALPLAMVIGWILNIVKLVQSEFVITSGMSIARAIGVFVAPLGSILGFF